jgi:hypothetical protein
MKQKPSWLCIVAVSIMELIFLQRITVRNRKPRYKTPNTNE